jgi:hypothetical protein
MGILLWLFIWLLICLAVAWMVYSAPWPPNMPPFLRWAINVIIGIFLLGLLIALLTGNLALPGVGHPLLR